MKHIMRIRLRPDGTWEHVYDNIQDTLNKLSESASEYLEEAVEASGYRDAKEVINYIRGL
jgi:hypothetical protein